MPWFKVDDALWSHPKFVMLTDAAQALWLRAGAWSAQYLTDGRIPAHVGPLIRLREDVADELIQAGLWDVEDEGWAFHDWDEYQPTKSTVESKREAARERMRRRRRGEDGKFEDSSDERSSDVRTNTTRTFGRSSEYVRPPRPGPSRPVPGEEHVATSGEVDDDAPAIDPNDRDDVRTVLDYLDEKIREVDPEAKLPSRTKANSDAARLLIDKDGRTVDQIKAAADYALDTEFWRPNIRSMSKLRAKYETLRAQAQRDQQQGPRHASGPVTAQERRRQLGAERHERIVSGEFQPGRPPIDEDALWAPRQIEEA